MLFQDLNLRPPSFNVSDKLDALNSFGIKDLLTDQDFKRITKLTAIVSSSPIALFYFKEKEKSWIRSNIELDEPLFEDSLFSKHTFEQSSFVEISNASLDANFADDKLVTGSYKLLFHAAIPLRTKTGLTIGSVQVYDTVPKQLTAAQVEGIKLIAEEITSLVDEHSSKTKLQNFEKLFEFSTDLVFIGGGDGYFQQINPAFETVLGWSKEKLLTTSTFDFLHPDDIASTEKELDKLQHGEHTINFLQRFKTINGDYKTIQWTSTPEIATGRIFGIGRDITEKHFLELELKDTKQMLEQTNKVAKVGGWSLDVDSKKVYWSSVTKEIHGVSPDYEPDLLTGINFYKEGESREKILNVLDIAFAKGRPWNLELQIINANGKEIWVKAIGSVEMEDGQCKRMYGTFQDINDSKLSEISLKLALERQDELNKVLSNQINLLKIQDKTIEKIQEFKFMADAVPQIIWTTKANGIPDYFNEHWYTYTGLSVEKSLSNGWGTILHPDDLERSLKIWHEAVTTGKTYEVEYRFKRFSDGAYKWHLGRGLPMKNDAGEIVKWFGSCTDIDEYKRALELESKINQYEDFNRIVAHNLRGPAGSIKMLLDLLVKEDCGVIEQRDLLTMLTQSSDILSETLNELMKVLEVRNNRNLPFDDCDIAEMVSYTERMLKGQIKSKQAILTTNLSCPTVKFPKLYLESIFYNIISNALKYSKIDIAPQILITCEKLNDKTLITFKDNGLGIDLNRHQENLFKLNKVFHRGFDSKGVGLFMTKTQIEIFGGSIWVDSEPGVGSTFFVEL